MMMMLGCFRHNEHSNKLVVGGTDMCCAVVAVVVDIGGDGGGDGEKELSRKKVLENFDIILLRMSHVHLYIYSIHNWL